MEDSLASRMLRDMSSRWIREERSVSCYRGRGHVHGSSQRVVKEDQLRGLQK